MSRKNNRRRRLARQKQKREKQKREKKEKPVREVYQPPPQRTPLQTFIQDELGLQQEPHTLPIFTKTSGQPTPYRVKRCHENCRLAVQRQPGYERVTCWIIHNSKEIVAEVLHVQGKITEDMKKTLPRPGEFEAEFHSILRNRQTGLLCDITPDYDLKCTGRMIVLEPRMSARDFETFNFSSPENIVTPTYAARVPIEDPGPDFFEQVKELAMYNTVLNSGTAVIVRGRHISR